MKQNSQKALKRVLKLSQNEATWGVAMETRGRDTSGHFLSVIWGWK